MIAREPTGATEDLPTDIARRTPRTAAGGTSGSIRDMAGESRRRRRAVFSAIVLAVLAFSALTVFRHAAANLQADAILQSVMSVQDVTLFYWGQDRLASVVSLLASPVADPMSNLFLCLLINALAFHVLLLMVARMGTVVVSGNRRWSSTLVLFLVMAAVYHTVVTAVYTTALDAQPYALSWALALGAFLLWKRADRWAWAVAIVLVAVAVGLNPSVILVPALLSSLEMFRRRQWVRWIVFGVVWVVWFAVWIKLSHTFPGDPGAKPDPARSYFSFSGTTLRKGAGQSVTATLSGLGRARLVVLIAIGCLATVVLSSERRAALLPRLLVTALFTAFYWALFTGNPWVALNGFHVRYFFPVLLAVVVAIAAPIGAALLTVPLPLVRGASRSAVAIGAATLAAAASIVGPLTPLSRAPIILATNATADYVRANNVSFVAGYYWLLWPVMFQTLDQGRTAVHGAGYRSDGDLGAYRAALDRALSDPQSPPRAICVGDQVSACRSYLEYVTRPGWREVAATCPMPSLPDGRPRPPPTNSCTVLEFRPS